jgi:hypothetical protein
MPYSQRPSLASSGTSTMSNANNGPRNMSCSDYIRLQRLRAMTGYAAQVSNNTDVTNPPLGPCVDACNGFGIGKYRRTASDWISYKASQLSDYVVTTDRDQPGMGRTMVVRTLCACPNPVSRSNIMNKDNICISCRYLIGEVRDPVANPIPGNEEWRPFCSGYRGV